jgi:hypothetical protein
MKEIKTLSRQQLEDLREEVTKELWEREHPLVHSLDLMGARGEDARKIQQFIKSSGINLPKSVIYNWLVEADRNDEDCMDMLEAILKLVNTFKEIKEGDLYFEDYDKGAQMTSYHLRQTKVFNISKDALTKLLMYYFCKNIRDLHVPRWFVKVCKEIEPVKLSGYARTERFGGQFHYEDIHHFRVKIPALVETHTHRLDGTQIRESTELEFIFESNERPKIEYSLTFDSILKEAAEVKNKTNFSIEGLAKLRARISANCNDGSYGDSYTTYELENGIRATLYHRRCVPASVGYEYDYTKLLVIS